MFATQFSKLAAFTYLLTIQLSTAKANGARANVTLRMSLSYELNTDCDDTAHKVVVCAGEFTNECQLFGPVARFVQASCASQETPEPLSFAVTSVENPIELDVTVQRLGDHIIRRLRRTEFRLTEGTEVTLTSSDLTLIVRFQADYVCLPNYFGRLCNRFCDTRATDHICDEYGNPICRSGYFLDPKLNVCRQDKCLSMPNFCLNGGTCLTNLDRSNDRPYCLCPPRFYGPQCEFEQLSTVTYVTTAERVSATNHSHVTPTMDVKVSTSSLTENPKKITEAAERTRKNSSSSPKGSSFLSQPGNQTLIQYSTYKRPLAASDAHWGPKASGSFILNTNRFLDGEDLKPQYGKVLLPILLVILIFSLIFACGGFLVWVIVRRKKTKNFDEKLKPSTSPVSLILSDVPRRWASVDQSPLRFCGSDNQTQSLQAASCLPTVNVTNSTFFGEPLDKDTLYGASVHSSFQPCTRFSAMDGSTYLGTGVDIPCKNEVTYCSTLPRQFPCISRRRTINGGLATPMYAPSLLYSNCFQMPDPIGNGNNNNNESGMMDSRLRAHTILGPPFSVENAQSYCVNSIPLNNSLTHSQLSSMHCGIPNCLGPIPSLASPYAYNIATTDADCRPNTGSCHMFNTTGFGVETTVEENHSSCNPSALPPPPPTQFADVYVRSAC